jgi:hypothetical protein
MNGENMAKLVADGPVQVYSPGWRNPYDVELTEDGRMYTIDNGGNAGWGDVPVGEGTAQCTNEPNDGGPNVYNSMQLVEGEGYYGGHPNPTRGNPDGTYPDAVPAANPVECDYYGTSDATGTPNVDDEKGSMYVFKPSTNGLDEYTASNFDGEMRGEILAASFDGTVSRIDLSADGESVDQVTQLASGFDGVPLDVEGVGDDGPFPGTVWVGTYGFSSGGEINVFEPSDYDGSTGGGTTCDPSNPDEDSDGDGYTNADERAAGTDPCNTASQPEDNDDDGVSDVTDPDDDDDGRPDTTDPFALDPDDGTTTAVPKTISFGTAKANDPLDAGFTGVMTNGTDYAALYDASQVTVGGASSVMTLGEIGSGTALGDANDQRYGFQFGVDAPDEPFTVHTSIRNGFDGQPAQPGQSYGVFLGDGSQSNYAKLVVAGGNGGEVRLVTEADDSVLDTDATAEPRVSGTDFELYLTVYPSNDTVRASYLAGEDASRTFVGEYGSLPASWYDSTDRGLAVGILGTSDEDGTVTASYETVGIGTAANALPAQPGSSDGNGTVDGPPALSGFEDAPTDPDGDGVYEDVNGDGSLSLSDVTAFFLAQDDPAVVENPAAFDVNGNGAVTLADVTALFRAASVSTA